MIGHDRNGSHADVWLDILDMAKMDPLLWKVLCFADTQMHKYGTHAIVTSFMEGRTTGVHSTGRAVDIRTRDLIRPAVRMVEAMINHEFPRSDSLFTCIVHDVGEGIHAHLQVSEATQIRGEER